MATLVGASGSLLLFTENGRGAVVDTSLNIVTDLGLSSILEDSQDWDRSSPGARVAAELAQGALSSLDIAITASAGRKYTIPKSVSGEAQKALAWSETNEQAGSPIGRHTASLLASGGQVDLADIRHISQYFPRHAIDSEYSGWKPSDDNFPSTQRISWGMWGGDAGQRWVSSVIEAENAKALTADGYVAPGYDENPAVYKPKNSYPADVNPFETALHVSETVGPEFIARVLMDGSGIDRLYRVDPDSTVYLWDDGSWDNMGLAGGNIWDYDKRLDGPKSGANVTHILVDPESAIIIAASLQQNPHAPVTLESINAVEAALAAGAVGDENWSAVDDTGPAVVAVGTPGDGIYTPQERSQNAGQQVRDADGKFAKMGSRVMIGGLASNAGVITALNPANNTITVKLDNGQSTNVPARSVQGIGQFVTTIPGQPVQPPQVDLSGILGEPRIPINQPQAHFQGHLPAMSSGDLKALLSNWPAWVKQQRDSFTPLDTPPQVDVMKKNSTDIGAAGRAMERRTHLHFWIDPYKHPLLRRWLRRTYSYSSVTGAGAPEEPSTEALDSSVAASTAALAGGDTMTPDNSDVQPLYLAEVSPDDPRAVLELVCIVPASSTSSAPATYKRLNGGWTPDPSILNDLRSATPPPIVPLDAPTLKDVTAQVDQHQAPKKNDGQQPVGGPPITQPNPNVPVDQLPTPVMSSAFELMVLWGPREDVIQSVVAAGGLDQTRGGAEKLRKYWTIGPGGAKIRWNSPGDWTRCVRHLGKYLGPRAKGYCALRHHEMDGIWPGDKANLSHFALSASGERVYGSDVLYSTEKIVERAFLRAEARTLKTRMGITASTPPERGAKFRIPLVIPEAVDSGDGRHAEPGALTWRKLPLPLMWQVQTASGHDASYVVGRIDYMERTMDGIGNAWGYFDTGEFGTEAERLVRSGMLRGISADLDQFEAQQEAVEMAESDEDPEAPPTVKKQRILITLARIMGATIVAKPAFQECEIFIDDEAPQEDTVIPDGVYVDDVDPIEAAALVAAGYVASAIPLAPPKDWFTNPHLAGPTPLTVDETGHVFGHIALWDTMHIGMANVRPPRSKSHYQYFHTGALRTEEGDDVSVGQITLSGGHASIYASASEAVKHYDDTASAIVDVKAGEDNYGIWVAGSVRPNASPEQIRALRASAPSGDWRPIRGNLELVAVCQVNVPGFPVARAVVASGQVMALVAAGAQTLAKMKSDPVTELTNRLESLEGARRAELEALVAGAKAKVHSIRDAELTAKAEALSEKFEALSEFSYVPRQQRFEMAKKGQAMPDGSFPIANVDDLHKAIQAYGRAKDKNAARKHIMKRARALGKSSEIPESWTTASTDAITASVENLRARVAAASADPKVKRRKVPEPDTRVDENDAPINADPNDNDGAGPKFTPKTQPRDFIGRFRDVLGRIKGDVGDTGPAEAHTQIKQTENLDSAGNYKAAVESAAKLANTLNRIAKGAGTANRRDNLRESSYNLSKTIAALPLPFGEDAQKVRFSDLPPAVREMVVSLVAQVESKKGADKAAPDVQALKQFMSGFHRFSQRNISSQLNKMIHILTN